MKTKEFVEMMESFGMFVIPNTTHGNMYVENKGRTIAVVKNVERYGLTTKFDLILDISDLSKKVIYEKLVEYAATPIEEREEEKRYWLQKIPVPLLDKGTEKKWLWKYTRTAPSNMFGVDTTKIDRELYKTIFTESEIAEMDITGFEKIEVMDGE